MTEDRDSERRTGRWWSRITVIPEDEAVGDDRPFAGEEEVAVQPSAMGIDPTVSPSVARLPVYLFRSLRPRQWTKNFAVFMAAVFTINLYWRVGDPSSLFDTWSKACAAFLVFSLLSSTVYLVNDVADIERDRMHPKKRFRPIAAGLVPPSVAIVTAIGLGSLALYLGSVISLEFGIVGGLYLGSQILYSFFFKHEVILDVFMIAAGFVLRVVGGAFAIGVPVSPWLYVCTTLGALFLALAKRRHELTLLEQGAANHRKSLEAYSIALLDQMITIVSCATVIAYSFYTFAAENLPKNHAMMLTIPFVLYGLFRYLYLIHRRGQGGSPEEVLLTDKPLLIDVGLWVTAAMTVLYLAR